MKQTQTPIVGKLTLAGVVDRLGVARVQQAIEDQRSWLREKHSVVAADFARCFREQPRLSVRYLRMGLSMAGFKSGMDMYLFQAYALGKLEIFGIK